MGTEVAPHGREAVCASERGQHVATGVEELVGRDGERGGHVREATIAGDAAALGEAQRVAGATAALAVEAGRRDRALPGVAVAARDDDVDVGDALRPVEQDLEATVVLGDFNAKPESETMKWVDANTVFPLVETTRESGPTFHWFGRLVPGSNDEPRKIDYIYLDPKSAETARDLEVWRDVEQGIYLSDHYPFTIKFDL